MATKTCNITRKASLIPTWSQKLFADISIEGSQELWNEADIYSHAHHWRSTVCMGLLFPSAFSSSSRSTLQLNLHKLTQTHWRVWLHHITLYCTHHSIVTCVEWGRSTLKSSWSSSASVMCVCVCVGVWVWVCGCGCVGVGVGVWVCGCVGVGVGVWVWVCGCGCGGVGMCVGGGGGKSHHSSVILRKH